MEGIAASNRRSGVAAFVALVFIALAVAPSAQAGILDRYASPDGQPTDACTQVDPCDLRTAVEGAPANGQIRLLAGDHDLGQTGLTVDGGKQVVADSQNSFASVSTRGNADPTLTVTGGASVRGIGVTSASLVQYPPDPLPQIPTVTFGGPALALGASDVIVDRVFARSISADATCEMEAGLLRDSVCFNSTNQQPDPPVPSDPPVPAQPDPGPAFAMTAPDDAMQAATIRNLTSFSREAAGGAFEAGTNATVELDARNVIFLGQEEAPASSADITTSGAGDVTVDIDFSNYSSVEFAAASGSVSAAGSGGNQATSPEFAAPLQGNFRQANGSPTIDAGSDAASDLGEFDLANNDRIQGEAIDIGAYEDTAADPPPDGGAPTVIIRSKPRKKTSKRKATFRFRAADTNAPATFRCKLDRRDLAPCSSPKRYQNLGRGTHKFVVRARGQNGKVGEPTRYRWKVTRKR